MHALPLDSSLLPGTLLLPTALPTVVFSTPMDFFLNELIGILFIMAWVGGIMTPFFFALNFFGIIGVDPLEEKVGVDISHHKGAAYDLTGPHKEDVDILTEKRATAHGKLDDSALVVHIL
jgi:hypothetical protein